MSRRVETHHILALDVGSAKVAALIGEIQSNGSIKIIGMSSQPARGLRKGVVTNMDLTVQAIKRAVENAELMANVRVQFAHVAISGTHIKSQSKPGVVKITHREVTQKDVDAVIENGSAMTVPADAQVLHVVPQEFIVDGHAGIHDPLGMSAARLEANVHVVFGASSAAQNLEKCIERSDLKVDKLVISHLASADAVLTEDERELGVCCLDIGGGTTDVAVFQGGSIRHTAVLAVGGEAVSSDIAVAFRTPTANAEDIKLRYGCAQPWTVPPSETIEAPSVGDAPPRLFSRHVLAEVIRPRYEELFRIVAHELHRADMFKHIPGGLVITGGAAQLPGVLELAEEVFELPVRLGFPHGVEGLTDALRDPSYSTSVGLLLYAKRSKPELIKALTNPEADWLSRVKNWFTESF